MFLIIKKKSLIVGALCTTFLCIAFICIGITRKSIIASTSTNVNWGLSFKNEGAQPIGNASREALKNNDAYFIGEPNDKVIYLTFDAGFENGYTPRILDALKKHDVKAAFFVVGNYVKTNPDLVKRMLREGHIVGNHTFTHPDMSKISDIENFKQELGLLEQAYKDVTGKDIQKYYRPPQGKYCESNLKNAKALGYKTVFWSLAYVDWYTDKQPQKDFAIEKLTKRIHPGAVVLLHSTSRTNSEIIDDLLSKWKEMGYSFGMIDQLK